MRKNIIKSIIAAALAAVMLVCTGCASLKRDYTKINGEKIYFASDYETEKWRKPLEKLLSNVEYTQYTDDVIGEIIGYKAQYPDEPSIPDGVACALFDLTCDGTPELLVDLGGGSAGNASYSVYDIYTGENVAYIESSPGESLCVYYDSAEGGLKIFNRYSWRCGWDSKMLFTSVIEPSEENGFTERMYLKSSYEMGIKNAAKDDFTIICKSMSCFIWGEEAEPEGYLFECEYFEETYVRIKETELKYFYWFEVTESGDTPDECGAKMAEALLSSGQRFVVYGE